MLVPACDRSTQHASSSPVCIVTSFVWHCVQVGQIQHHQACTHWQHETAWGKAEAAKKDVVTSFVVVLCAGRADDRGTKLNTRVDTGSRRQTRAQRKQQRNEAREAGRPEKEDILEVGLEGMSVQDLADKLAVAPTEILKELFMKGIMAQVNQVSNECNS